MQQDPVEAAQRVLADHRRELAEGVPLPMLFGRDEIHDLQVATRLALAELHAIAFPQGSPVDDQSASARELAERDPWTTLRVGAEENLERCRELKDQIDARLRLRIAADARDLIAELRASREELLASIAPEGAALLERRRAAQAARRLKRK